MANLSWAIQELKRSQLPACVHTARGLNKILIDFVEYEPEDSDAHEAAQAVLETPYGFEVLLESLGIWTAIW